MNDPASAPASATAGRRPSRCDRGCPESVPESWFIVEGELAYTGSESEAVSTTARRPAPAMVTVLSQVGPPDEDMIESPPGQCRRVRSLVCRAGPAPPRPRLASVERHPTLHDPMARPGGRPKCPDHGIDPPRAENTIWSFCLAFAARTTGSASKRMLVIEAIDLRQRGGQTVATTSCRRPTPC